MRTRTLSRFGLPPILVLLVTALPAGGAEIVQVVLEKACVLPGGKEVDAIPDDNLLRSATITATIGCVTPFRDANVNTQAVQEAVLDSRREEFSPRVPRTTAFPV